MKNDMIHLLVSFDQNYIKPFQTMIKSLSVSNSNEVFHICLLHSSISREQLQELEAYCGAHRMILSPILIDRTFFEDAPVSRQYPQEMYYRLVAPLLLPPTLDRILYLDPDILVINPVRPLWELSLGENVFAAASHSSVFEIMNDVNRARLGKKHDYFNTGVLLIDLGKARAVVTADDVFGYVREQADKLLLPDQDVFNVLYGHRTLQIDDAIFNYDVRYFSAYLLKSDGQYTMNWVMRNTVFLHFCGRHKPWKNMCLSRFSALYQHYMNLAQKAETNKPYTVRYTKVILAGDRLRRYFPDVNMTPRQIEESVYEALEERRQRLEKQKQKDAILKKGGPTR